MAKLVRESSILRFEESEFLDFFGVDGPLDEDACSYTYELERDGLRLVVTVFPLDGGVYTSLYRDGVADAIVSSRLEGCTHVRVVARNDARFMEIGRPERPTRESTAPPTWGLRISVDPHFRLEHIHEIA